MVSTLWIHVLVYLLFSFLRFNIKHSIHSLMFIYTYLSRFPSVSGQFGMMIQLEINPDSSKIPVLSLQEKVQCIF